MPHHDEQERTMSYVTGITRGKKEWTPRFVKAIDSELCIGCGRCIKICAHDVLAPAEVDEEESDKMFAIVAHPDDCIGCEACGRTCKKEAFAFEPMAA
jgi:Nif-specific ferredoxin III